MNNCLVTKLKATVNNPNLPILETMQQFTLDAIAASGNDSMTDSQKWALNHFFYRIGAIDNSGIYTKMEHLIMPLICNQNRDTAVYDYKTDTNYTLGVNAIFYGNGLKGGTVLGSSQITRNTSLENTFVAVAFTEQTSTFNAFTYMNYGNCSSTLQGQNDNVRYSIVFNKMYIKSTIEKWSGLVVSRNGDYSVADNWKYKYFNSDRVCDESVSMAILPTSSGSYIDDPATPYNIALNAENIPVSIWAWGTHLSEEECATLADALRELVVAFPTL